MNQETNIMRTEDIKFGKNLESTLYKKGQLYSGISVKSKLCDFELTLYGFVPIINDFINMRNPLFDITKDYTIGYGNIRLKMFQPASSSSKHISILDIFMPIADTIEMSSEKVPLNFYMKILNPDVDLHTENLCKNALKVQGTCPLQLPDNNHFMIENDTIFYIPSPNDITFYRNRVVAVANRFLCVCNYINPVTGEFSKTLLPPEDLYPVM